jgi:hypothetical protein
MAACRVQQSPAESAVTAVTTKRHTFSSITLARTSSSISRQM